MEKITRCHTFTKEINHARARSQYSSENFYCKNCLRVFSAMTGKAVLLIFHMKISQLLRLYIYNVENQTFEIVTTGQL